MRQRLSFWCDCALRSHPHGIAQTPMSTANPTPRDDRADRLALLLRERDELRASLPAHSIPPAMLIRLDDLEDAIATLRAAIASRTQSSGASPD